MAAVSVLLAKTRYPATLYQTDREGGYREEHLPFDIAVDFVPELLRDTDRSLELLAARVPGEIEGFENIVGRSPAIRLAVGRAERVSFCDANVFLRGETGTGKELFARAIHRASRRGRDDPNFERFHAVNCAAFPADLLEAELFGAEGGVATDVHEHPGAFERADGGTLFLDEVGSCSPTHQAKLLRALQPRKGDPVSQRWVRRVGGTSEQPFDVRLIAATNENLLLNTETQSYFRQDLYFRLARVLIELPPLRERRTDIELLAKDILGRINRELEANSPNHRDKLLTAPAIRRLRQHDWPGNVRELENVLYQAAVMQFEARIGRGDVEAAITKIPSKSAEDSFSRQRGESFSLKGRLDEIERALVEDAMEDADGNQTTAAKFLGITPQAVSKKLKKWHGR